MQKKNPSVIKSMPLSVLFETVLAFFGMCLEFDKSCTYSKTILYLVYVAV